MCFRATQFPLTFYVQMGIKKKFLKSVFCIQFAGKITTEQPSALQGSQGSKGLQLRRK